MMATTGPPTTNTFLPLLESLEDSTAGPSEQTDAYLTIANRLSGEEGRQFLPAVEKHFSRLGKAILTHIASPNAELSQSALQALGFCVYHSHIVSGLSEILAADILSALCSLVVKSTDKNTCTRALWVISKQSFPTDVVAKKVPMVLTSLESVWSREDLQSVVMEHEALNVIIRMLEQVPTQMGNAVVQWTKMIVPLVVHSASKVRLRAAAAMEMGLPLLLAKQTEVAAVIEPMMSSKLIPELQKLFMTKNETNVLKLWPLFVKLLGKLLHRGGPFINSLLHLEELGFRSSSPTIKKIAFIAWKSLIDNFALNPDILCSAKRMKLLMQPLASIHVRTEALMLTKVEVWWYLVVQLGPNLSSNFDQVALPLLQTTIGNDSSSVLGTPSRAIAQNGAVAPSTPKSGNSSFNATASTPRMNLNSSMQVPSTFPSIQLLGLEMLLHYFLGPDVVAAAGKNKFVLNLEPLKHTLLTGASSFSKHAAVLISNVRDGFVNVGKDAPESLLAVLWTSLVRFVSLTIDSVGSKKDRQGCEALTLMLQALQSIVTSEALPAHRILVLLEATLKAVPQRVLGSASYQVGKMDVLNGTPALFLILLLFNSNMLPAFTEDERFFHCLQTLVGCGLSGPASPLAFAEAVLGAVSRSARALQNKEQVWRMWSVMVTPLTDTVTQSNEVNQGDALEHNFSAMHSALMFPVTHLLRGSPLPQPAQKSMLSSWSKLYKVFARCSALVVTAEENICCEELCVKIAAAVDKEALAVPSTLNAVASFLHVVVESVDFSPFSPHFQQKLKSPHTPVNWARKRNRALGNLSAFQSLLVQCLQVYLEAPEVTSEGTGPALVSILSTLFTNLVLANAVQEALTSLVQPLTLLYKQAAGEPPKFSSHLLGKLEKLLSEVLSCLQTRSSVAYNDELLALLSPLLCVLFPHKNKHLRTAVTQFWNATFANAVTLTYPEEIRPILSQVKHKTPIILPGFEVVSSPDDLSGLDSSESSQLEAKLSGMPISSAGKRDSLLGKAAELKDKSSTTIPRPVSQKLDFGSPKLPRRQVLEEEASIDFVFIPPETKERVLTEHQKEVKRTKRVDIPAMYNNLDASLDTTVFTQYTQSQEDSLDKTAAEQPGNISKEAPDQVNQEEEEMDKEADILSKETKDYASPKEKMTENSLRAEIIPDSTDVSMEDEKNNDAEDVDKESKDDTSLNTSSTSDLVSGTPQKQSSRRQSFITLEKYAEGKPASPSSVSSFTGPLVKTSNSQKHNTSNTSSYEATPTSTGPNSQDSAQTGKVITASDAPESPRRPKESRTNSEPVKLIERLINDSDEDVIPDTQTKMEDDVAEEEMKSSSQEEDSEPTLDDSQSSQSESLDQPRRSGRHRVRPQLPGEDPEDRDAKYTPVKRRRSGEVGISETPKTMQAGPNTRSKQAAEENSGRLRTRSQRDSNGSSQTNSVGRPRKKVKLYSSAGDFLDERRRRRTSELEASKTDIKSDTASDHESQTPIRKRRGRKRRSLVSSEKAGIPQEEMSQDDSVDLTDRDDHSQTDSQTVMASPEINQDGQSKTDSQTVMASPEMEDKDGRSETDSQTVMASPEINQDGQSKTDSQTVMASPQMENKDGQSKTDSQTVMASPEINQDGQSKTDSQTVMASPEMENKDGQSKTDSQTVMASPEMENKDGQSKPDSQTVMASPEMENKDGQSKTDSQTVMASPEINKDGQSKTDSQTVMASPEMENKDGQSKTDSQTVMASPEMDTKLDEIHPEEKDRKDEKHQEESEVVLRSSNQPNSQSEDTSQMGTSTPTNKSKDETTNKLESQEMIKEHHMPIETTEDDLSQDNSQATPLSSDSQTKRRSKRAKAVSEEADKGDNIDSVGPRRRSQTATPVGSQTEPGIGGRTRRSKVQEETSKSGSSSTPESSQGRGRYSRRRSSQTLADGVESSESETSELQEKSLVPKRRGRKPRASLQSPLTLESKDSQADVEELDGSQTVDSHTLEAKPDFQESSETQDLQESQQVAGNVEEPKKEESPMETETSTVVTLETVALKEPVTDSTTQSSKSPCNRQRDSQTNDEDASLQDVEVDESDRISSEQRPDLILAPADALSPPEGASEKLQISESPDDKGQEVCEAVEGDAEKQMLGSDSDHQEPPAVPEEDAPQEEHPENQIPCERSAEEEQSASKLLAEGDAAPLQEDSKDSEAVMDGQKGTETASTELAHELTSEPTTQGSPMKQKDLETVTGPDVDQSPSDGRTRGTWSPSASPSTSILKKGQKRSLEVDTTSPLVKSRRVSFANPIQQQETADDIDRRSPALRTSSPRRSKVSNIPQPKLVTTPTKGFLSTSPRNLHSPGFKSSKKCLISEMSQEPRAVSKDCIYPALVGCSAPVEAVVPQISSTMWSRGFGKLVRARNIKTVGDLSALTPSEIKTLPIRSPKVSNVKKALKIYEQQRKGRGGDELKSFDETEMMTSELEEVEAPPHMDEEEKTSGEMLATELLDDPPPGDEKSEQNTSAVLTRDMADGDHSTSGATRHEELPSAVESLTCRVTPLELGRCSPRQLVEMHEQLGDAMRRVVVEMQTRLSGADAKH